HLPSASSRIRGGGRHATTRDCSMIFRRRTPRSILPASVLGLAVLLIGGAGISASSAASMDPAVYVTTVDGSTTNPASFPTRDDVYLAAAPCPRTAAVLPAGEYYFEVTDETGTNVLSADGVA